MHTQITFVLDASGSMATIKDDTVGGFNAFLDDHRSGPGTATVALYEFHDTVSRRYQGTPVREAPRLDPGAYLPGGRTALHDAIVTAIRETDAYLDAFPPARSPENVIVVVLTDGKENASETPAAIVRELVAERRTEYGWEFLFIGANQDAALTANTMGMAPEQALNMSHTGAGARAAYEATSERIQNARETGTAGSYHEQDRQRQRDADSS